MLAVGNSLAGDGKDIVHSVRAGFSAGGMRECLSHAADLLVSGKRLPCLDFRISRHR